MLAKEYKYDREKIVSKYAQVDPHQYALLPFEVQMAYADKFFGIYIRKAQEKGEAEFLGSMHEMFRKYLEVNGCKAETFDDFVTVTKIECVNDATYTVSEDAKNKLDYYFNVVINSKLDAFEKYYLRTYGGSEMPDSLDRTANNVLNSFINDCIDNIIVTLPKNEFDGMANAALVFVLKDIGKGEKVDLPMDTPMAYRRYFVRHKDHEAISKTMQDIARGKDVEWLPPGITGLFDKNKQSKKEEKKRKRIFPFQNN